MPKKDPPRRSGKHKPWYAPTVNSESKGHGSEWQAKRDNWEKFSAETFQPSIQPSSKNISDADSSPVYDTYSRTYARSSQRNRGETAHYLLDVGDAPKFNDSGMLRPGNKPPSGNDDDDNLPIYTEDILDFGHKSVWGSYWTDGRWGYACCHQLERDAPCR